MKKPNTALLAVLFSSAALGAGGHSVYAAKTEPAKADSTVHAKANKNKADDQTDSQSAKALSKDRIAALETEKANLETRLAGANDQDSKDGAKAELNRIESLLNDAGVSQAPAKKADKKTSAKPKKKTDDSDKQKSSDSDSQNSQSSNSQVDSGGAPQDVKLPKNATARQKVIAVAKSLIGVPYVWGGSNPATGLDCSGLTSYCYSQVGINTGRTTYDQDATGKHVSLSDLKPGDLILEYGKGHVAMYIGNGQQIAAPEPGDHVKIQPVPYNYGAMYGLRYLA